MKNSKGQKILLEVARKNGVSLEEARKEINIAIDVAMNDPDPAVQEQWKNMKFKDKRPTPEEFVIEMSRQAKKEKEANKGTYLS